MILLYWNELKELTIAVGSAISGYIAGKLFAFYQAPDSGHRVTWYENPAVIAALVSGLFFAGAKLYDHHDKKKEQEKEDAEEEAEKHQTYSEKMAEITERSWQTYLRDLKDFHERQMSFKDAEILDKDVTVYRYRKINHVAFNEVQRLHGRIRQIEVEYAKCSGVSPLPEFEFKYQEEIQAAVEEDVRVYRESLRKNLVAASIAHHETSGAPDKME